MRSPPPAAADAAAPLSAAEFARLLDRPRAVRARRRAWPSPFPAGPTARRWPCWPDDWAARAWRLGAGADRRPRAAPGIRGRSHACGSWAGRSAASAARILVWPGDKPATGMQAAARERALPAARGRLPGAGSCICSWATTTTTRPRPWRCGEAAAAAPTGLAGMAAVREVPGVRLLRPLLAVPKARLLATLSRRPAVARSTRATPSRALPAAACGQERASTGERTGRRALRPREAARRAWSWSRRLAGARIARPHALGFVRARPRGLAIAAPDERGLWFGPCCGAVGGDIYPTQARDACAPGRRCWRLDGARTAAAAASSGVATRHLIVVREPGAHPRCAALGPGRDTPVGRPLYGPLPRRPDRRWTWPPWRCGRRRAAARPARPSRRRHACGGAGRLAGAWAANGLVGCPPLIPHWATAAGLAVTAALRPACRLAGAPFAG